MENIINKLIVYNDLSKNSVFKDIARILFEDEKKEKTSLAFGVLSRLIEAALEIGLKGNILESYILSSIIFNQNIFSLQCEQYGEEVGTGLKSAAIHDIRCLMDFCAAAKEYMSSLCKEEDLLKVFDYEGAEVLKTIIPEVELRNLYNSFAKNNEVAFIKILCNHYKKWGSGKLAQYRAFSFDNNKGLSGIRYIDKITFEDLIGYEHQKEELIKNTEAFLEGKKANNVLLFGDRGTGKSSCVKALINRYADKGLRLIEMTRDNLKYFSDIYEVIRKRGFKFIVFMDDLSFEEFEVEYKYMKAMIEGRVLEKPDNVLIYVTSNRRHLIKETFADREGANAEIHSSDSVQEKISLSDRFGLTITFTTPEQENYLNIVYYMAEKNGIEMPREELRRRAIQWTLWHNGRSGRAARQFIIDLMQS